MMGAQLNIKDAETVRKARELARRRQQPVTSYFRALIERDWQAEEAKTDAVLEEVRAISADFVANMPIEWRGKTSRDIMDSIYDDHEPDGFAR